MANVDRNMRMESHIFIKSLYCLVTVVQSCNKYSAICTEIFVFTQTCLRIDPLMSEQLPCWSSPACTSGSHFVTPLSTFALIFFLKLITIRDDTKFLIIMFLVFSLSSLTVRHNKASLYVTRIGVECQGGQRLIVKYLEGAVLIQSR